MAEWIYPTENTITGATKIKDADDKIQGAMNDLNDWINNTGDYSGGSGATYGSIADATDTDIATPTNEDGLRYNSTTSKYENVPLYSKTQLYSKADTDTLLDSKQVAGTYNTVIGTDTNIDTSGANIIDGLEMTDGVITSHATRVLTLGDLGYTGATNANDYVLPSSVVHETEYATSTVGGTVKARLNGSTLYLTINGNNA